MHSMFNRRYRDYIWLVLIKFNTFPSGRKDSSASAKVFPSRLTGSAPSEGKPLPQRHGQDGRGETMHTLAGGSCQGLKAEPDPTACHSYTVRFSRVGRDDQTSH